MLSRIPLRNFSSSKFTPIHTQICVIGGGTSGLNFVSQLLHQKGVKRHQIRVFEPSKHHFDQFSWNMVAGGFYDASLTVKKNSDLYSKWINFNNSKIVKIDPKRSVIETNEGVEYSYEHLIIASGLECDYTQIKGAQEALESVECPVGTVYDYNYAQKFNELVQEFGGGKAIFTEPSIPFKNQGSPQSIAYLTEDRINKKGVRQTTNIEFRNESTQLYPQPKYSQSLERMLNARQIQYVQNSRLVEIKPASQVAVFENIQTKVKEEIRFDLAHIAPPMKTADFIKNNPQISDNSGLVDVNHQTLQHKRYDNIWALGDCANLPTAKTFGAIISQTPIVVKNITHILSGQGLVVPHKYNGYTSSPIFVGEGKMILTEHKYDQEVCETFSKQQERPSSIMFKAIKKLYPWFYWNWMPKGLWI
ncbi:hypothetical protein ABPG74_000564 [Tetrahymena malaccensis]